MILLYLQQVLHNSHRVEYMEVFKAKLFMVHFLRCQYLNLKRLLRLQICIYRSPKWLNQILWPQTRDSLIFQPLKANCLKHNLNRCFNKLLNNSLLRHPPLGHSFNKEVFNLTPMLHKTLKLIKWCNQILQSILSKRSTRLGPHLKERSLFKNLYLSI
jgi:hypothetical protein